MAFKKKEEKKEEKPFQDDWQVEGWISRSKDGKTIYVADTRGELLGFIQVSSLKKFLEGAIKGCPIKLPKEGKINA